MSEHGTDSPGNSVGIDPAWADIDVLANTVLLRRYSSRGFNEALHALTERAKQACAFGCGPYPDDGSQVGGPSIGLVPACPVHGWACGLLDARDAFCRWEEMLDGAEIPARERLQLVAGGADA